MKKFLLKVIIFISLIAISAFFLDKVISSGLNQMEDYRFQTWSDIVDSKINADVLIMGNSRAFSHYSPAIIDSAFNVNSYNLGIGGHPFNVQYLRYKVYESHNVTPKVIIQNIDFFTFRTDIIGHQREQIFPYITDSTFRRNLVPLGFNFLEIYLPLYRYFGYQMVVKNGILESFGLKHYNHQPSYKGYRPEMGNWDPDALNNLEKIESFADTASIKLFEKFIEECNQKNIQLILVYSPVYFEALQKLPNNTKFNALFHNLAIKHSLTYLDYSKDSICKDTNYFHVAIHLNKMGAEWFTRKLCNDLIPVLN